MAQRIGGEILSVDSMQVYRGMDIGTAKPSGDEQALVRHHMIDLVEPHEPYSAAQFQAAARAVLAASSRPIIIVGGSGLHFRAVVDPLEFPPTDTSVRSDLERLSHEEQRRRLLSLDPEAAAHVDLANSRRVVRALEIAELTGVVPSRRSQSPQAHHLRAYDALHEFVAFGIDRGTGLGDAVASRLDAMRKRGFTKEVVELADRLGPTAAGAVGYRQLLPAVRGEIDEDQGYADARRATMALAKRQRTFFRRDPRIRWISTENDAVATVMSGLETM